jgi:hypothetical protein
VNHNITLQATYKADNAMSLEKKIDKEKTTLGFGNLQLPVSSLFAPRPLYQAYCGAVTEGTK